MISKTLGTSTDVLALILVWTSSEMKIGWKIVITVACLLFGAAVLFFEKGSFQAKLVDYEFDSEKGILKNVFIRRNSQFRENALASLYYRNHTGKELSAIGYVLSNHDEDFQVKIVKRYGNKSKEIANTATSHKDFYVTPIMMFNETSDLFDPDEE